MTDGLGAGVSFDASGVGKATVQAAVDALAPQGRAVLVASFHGDVPLDVGPILAREKHLTGSFAYTAEEFGEVRDALVDGRLRVERLVTSRLHLRDVVDRGIEHLLGEGRTSEVKVLVTPDDSTLEEARGHADARSTATN
jgi:threonine dehydrogenase-like Zn-dependent dehydrogenase